MGTYGGARRKAELLVVPDPIATLGPVANQRIAAIVEYLLSWAPGATPLERYGNALSDIIAVRCSVGFNRRRR